MGGGAELPNHSNSNARISVFHSDLLLGRLTIRMPVKFHVAKAGGGLNFDTPLNTHTHTQFGEGDELSLKAHRKRPQSPENDDFKL